MIKYYRTHNHKMLIINYKIKQLRAPLSFSRFDEKSFVGLFFPCPWATMTRRHVTSAREAIRASYDLSGFSQLYLGKILAASLLQLQASSIPSRPAFFLCLEDSNNNSMPLFRESERTHCEHMRCAEPATATGHAPPCSPLTA